MARKLYNRSNTQSLLGASVSQTPIFERSAPAQRAASTPQKSKFTSWLDGLLTPSAPAVQLPWEQPDTTPKTNQAPTGTPIIPGGHARTTRARRTSRRATRQGR